MYYEEREIDGILCWRIHPNDEFIPYTNEELSERIKYYRNKLKKLKEHLDNIDDFFKFL